MTLTIGELKQRWPSAEKALETQEEIILTQDGRPVARLVALQENFKRRPRFDPKKHVRELKKMFGGKTLPSSDKQFAALRTDRI